MRLQRVTPISERKLPGSIALTFHGIQHAPRLFVRFMAGNQQVAPKALAQFFDGGTFEREFGAGAGHRINVAADRR
jgi:hypothetical protein